MIVSDDCLNVLRAFENADGELSETEVVRRSRMPPNDVKYQLRELVRLRFVNPASPNGLASYILQPSGREYLKKSPA